MSERDKKQKVEEEKDYLKGQLSLADRAVMKDSLFGPMVDAKGSFDRYENLKKEGWVPSDNIQRKINLIENIISTSNEKYNGKLTDKQIDTINKLNEEIYSQPMAWTKKK